MLQRPDPNCVPNAPRLPLVGVDLAQVSSIAHSLNLFGNRFSARLFTPGEIAYANSGSGSGLMAERLAARFAAKEAVIKMLGLGEAVISWREIEVVKEPGGDCSVRLHGRTAELARKRKVQDISISLTHEGDYAAAVAAAWLPAPEVQSNAGTRE
jgi:holo-[acyl-carrier protein] synthase